MSGDPIVIEGSAFPRHEFVFGECLRCNWRRRGNYIYSPTAWQVSAKYAKACFALRTEHEPDSWPSMRHAHCGGWMAERPLTGEWASDYVTLEPFWMALSRAERHGLHGIHAVGLSRNEEHTEDAETLRLARVNCSAKPNSCP